MWLLVVVVVVVVVLVIVVIVAIVIVVVAYSCCGCRGCCGCLLSGEHWRERPPVSESIVMMKWISTEPDLGWHTPDRRHRGKVSG